MKKAILSMVIALFAMTTVSAQEVGNWAVGPKIGLYTNSGTIFSIGAIGRYSFTDNWRIEPGISVLCKKGCSIDLNADVQYLFQVADAWTVYPLAGISVNDIGGWSCGINLGGAADFSVAENWDITAGIKWMIQTAKLHSNPIIISVGATYKF